MAATALGIAQFMLIAALVILLTILALRLLDSERRILKRLSELEGRLNDHVNNNHYYTSRQAQRTADPRPFTTLSEREWIPTPPPAGGADRRPYFSGQPPAPEWAPDPVSVSNVEPWGEAPASVRMEQVTADMAWTEYRRLCAEFPSAVSLGPGVERSRVAFREEIRDAFGGRASLVFEDDSQVAGFLRIGAIDGNESWLFADPAARYDPIIEMVFPEITDSVLGSPRQVANVPPIRIVRRSGGLWELPCQTS
jgi:hypothetical protein